jgi:hypothetical protein
MQLVGERRKCAPQMNLGLNPVIVEGESIPAHHVAVREQWYRPEFGTVKAKARRRNVPMGRRLVEALCLLRSTATLRGPEDVVFSCRAGRPVDAGAMLKRQLRKAAAGIGVPNNGPGRRTAGAVGVYWVGRQPLST